LLWERQVVKAFAKGYPCIAHERETCTKHRTTNVARAAVLGGSFSIENLVIALMKDSVPFDMMRGK
jgi:hypothetical protein